MRDALHWLIFRWSDKYKRFVIVGCHCGFEADVDSDAGWGDSVVEHLLLAGENRAKREAK